MHLLHNTAIWPEDLSKSIVKAIAQPTAQPEVDSRWHSQYTHADAWRLLSYAILYGSLLTYCCATDCARARVCVCVCRARLHWI